MAESNIMSGQENIENKELQEQIKRMEQRMGGVEQKLDRLYVAIVGDLESENGMLYRLRRVEDEQTEIKPQVEANTKFRERLIWVTIGAAAVGGVSGGGIVAWIMQAVGG